MADQAPGRQRPAGGEDGPYGSSLRAVLGRAAVDRARDLGREGAERRPLCLPGPSPRSSPTARLGIFVVLGVGAAVIGTAANDTVDDNEEDVADGTLDERLRSTAPEASDIYRGRRHGEGGLAVFEVLRGRPELRLRVQGSVTASGPFFTLA